MPPPNVTVQTATTFSYGAIPCRLLGVRDSADAAVRARALVFTRNWFKTIGNYVGFYNESNPLVARGGTCIVWVRGYDSQLSCLNEELVRAGLVEVDVATWRGYTFTEPAKSEDFVEDWPRVLAVAKQQRAWDQENAGFRTVP
jgi:hypothetical protein